MPLAEIATALTGEVIHERRAIVRSVKGLYHLLRRGRQRVLVAGSGGTGKTTLGILLGKPPKRRADRIDGGYTVSQTVEHQKIPGLYLGRIDILPGNSFFLKASVREWKPYLDRVSDGYYSGIIHVVSGGFHTLAEGMRYDGLYADETPKSREELIQAHVRSCIARERDLLWELAHVIRQRKKDCWLMTLITKEDLWEDQFEPVFRLYQSGPYWDIVEKLQQEACIQIRHVVTAVSLNLVNLQAGDDIVRKTQPGFDQTRCSRSINHFIGQFEQLVRLRDVPNAK